MILDILAWLILIGCWVFVVTPVFGHILDKEAPYTESLVNGCNVQIAAGIVIGLAMLPVWAFNHLFG